MLREFNYSTEGWGITHDSKHLIMSDGTPTLYFLDPETFEVKADGKLLTCEPAEILPMSQRYFLY